MDDLIVFRKESFRGEAPGESREGAWDLLWKRGGGVGKERRSPEHTGER